jgi:hypothetical protein
MVAAGHAFSVPFFGYIVFVGRAELRAKDMK